MKARWASKVSRVGGRDITFSLESFAHAPIPPELVNLPQTWAELSPLLTRHRAIIEAAVASYQRDNGKEKYLLRIPTLGLPPGDVNSVWLMQHFDTLLVVDTNTRMVGENRFRSVSSAARFQRRGVEFVQVWEESMRFNPLEHLERVGENLPAVTESDVGKPAEKFGVIRLLEYFHSDNTLGFTAIVTDSDMGLHPAFNFKAIPLLPEQPLLDQKFLLLYACSDVPTVHPLCELMAARDREAREVMRKWIAGG